MSWASESILYFRSLIRAASMAFLPMLNSICSSSRAMSDLSVLEKPLLSDPVTC